MRANEVVIGDDFGWRALHHAICRQACIDYIRSSKKIKKLKKNPISPDESEKKINAYKKKLKHAKSLNAESKAWILGIEPMDYGLKISPEEMIRMLDKKAAANEEKIDEL